MEMLGFDINSAKSYATKENLTKALAKLPESWKYVVVRNMEGRFTAIFQASSLEGMVAGPCFHGFSVLG